MIEKEEVEKIAKLSRLGLNLKEKEGLQKDLSSILDYFNTLKTADTSLVEPSFHPNEVFLSGKDIMRQDKEKSAQSWKSEKLVDLAPEKENSYIKVKSVF